MDESQQKIALFIDADNAPADKFEDILSEVAKYGSGLAICRWRANASRKADCPQMVLIGFVPGSRWEAV